MSRPLGAVRGASLPASARILPHHLRCSSAESVLSHPPTSAPSTWGWLRSVQALRTRHFSPINSLMNLKTDSCLTYSFLSCTPGQIDPTQSSSCLCPQEEQAFGPRQSCCSSASSHSEKRKKYRGRRLRGSARQHSLQRHI